MINDIIEFLEVAKSFYEDALEEYAQENSYGDGYKHCGKSIEKIDYIIKELENGRLSETNLYILKGGKK